MPLSFNWIDLIIIGTLLFFILESIGRPLILEVLDFLSFLLAFFISFSFYNFLANFFEHQFSIPHGLSLVLGFISTWFLTETIFMLAIKLAPIKWPKINVKGEKFLAIIPSFLRGLIFIALILVLMGTFPIQPTIKKAIQDSRLGSLIQKNAYKLEAPVKSVFGNVSDESLTFLTIKPKTDERVELGFKTEEFKVDLQDEVNMIDLVNKERVKVGLEKLTLDSKLRDVGRSHSGDMFKRGYFSHYSPENETVADRAVSAGIDFLIIGENLAFSPSLEAAHRGLMNSEGHRANILSKDYHKIGVGVMDGGVYGKMFTQVFSN